MGRSSKVLIKQLSSNPSNMKNASIRDWCLKIGYRKHFITANHEKR
jgi:hypothetical protein